MLDPSRYVTFADGEIDSDVSKILLAPFGNVRVTKGGKQIEYTFSEADADACIEEFTERGKEVVIDFEHKTLSGEEAPAAGWISEIFKTTDGMFAKVASWTDKAKGYLKNREYRYFSPVFTLSRTGKSFRSVHSVALTNHPAMHNIPALVADDTASEQKHKDTKNMENTILSKLAELAGIVAFSDTPENIQSLFEAMEKIIASQAELVKECDSLNEKIKSMVPVEEKKALEEKLALTDAESTVDAFIRDGKMSPAQRESGIKLALTDSGSFKAFYTASKSIIPKTPEVKTDEVKTEAFSDLTKEIAANCGVTLEG